MFEYYHPQGYLQLGQTVILVGLGTLAILGIFSRRLRASRGRWTRFAIFLVLGIPIVLIDWWLNQGVGGRYPTNIAVGAHYVLLALAAILLVILLARSYRSARQNTKSR